MSAPIHAAILSADALTRPGGGGAAGPGQPGGAGGSATGGATAPPGGLAAPGSPGNMSPPISAATLAAASFTVSRARWA